MAKLRHFLYLIFLGFKFPFYYCGMVSVLLVLFMNFCFTQYNELEKKRQTLNQLDYSKIFRVTFSIPEGNQYEQLKNKLANDLKGNAVILNYQRNPLYTTAKNNRIVPIRVITAEEAEFFHIFHRNNDHEDVYSVITSDNLKNQFQPGSEYSLPIGMYVHEETWKMKIKVVDRADNLWLISPNYSSLSKLRDTLLIYDPNNTLPLHISPGRKPVFHLYLYIKDDEKTITTLKKYHFIQIKSMQDILEHSANVTSQILPSYFKFLLLAIFIYLVLSINFYVSFYYKKKKNILIFNYCNLNHKFYLQCIGTLTLLQLCFGFIFGQFLWFCCCKLSGTYYWHNERMLIPLLTLIHLCIFIFLNRGYNYLARTYH